MEGNRALDAIDLGQVYTNDTGRSIKRVAFVIYLLPHVLLNFIVNLGQNLMYNVHAILGLVFVEYWKCKDGAEKYKEVERIGMIGMASRNFVLSSVEDPIALTTGSRIHDYKVKYGHSTMRIILDELFEIKDEWFDINSWRDSCRQLFLVVVAYCCDIYEKKNMSRARHASIVCLPCILFLVSYSGFESTKSAG